MILWKIEKFRVEKSNLFQDFLHRKIEVFPDFFKFDFQNIFRGLLRLQKHAQRDGLPRNTMSQ